MSNTDTETPMRLVLLGGGHSQVEVVRRFAMEPWPNCRITLITRDALAPYSGMLPGFVSGHYRYDECHIDIRPLAEKAGALFLQTEVSGLDLEKRLVRCPGRPPVPFDLLSVNIGSRPFMGEIPGADRYAIPAKPVDAFIERWDEARRQALDARDAYRIAVVGGGAGGVELILSMQYKLEQECSERGIDASRIEFALYTQSEDIIPTHNSRVRKKMRRHLESRSIRLLTDHTVEEVNETELLCANHERYRYDALFWTTQAAPAPWIADSGLATDERGFIAINEDLQSTSHDFVFAAGDVASSRQAPRPKSGVFAVRQGPFLADNLRRATSGQNLLPYHPQRRFLSLLSTGDKNAVASRGAWAAEGRLLWDWKDHIDQKFMDKYKVGMGASMDTDEPPAMHCNGCGAKVGRGPLEGALERLRAELPGDCVDLDRPDDAAVEEPPPGKVALHTVDSFPALLADPYRFGQVTAVHALNDIFAMGGEPKLALATVTLPYEDPLLQEERLYQLLAGALDIFQQDGVKLSGGHTTEGPQFQFGLSVTGYASRDELWRKGPPRAGQSLIMTKPLGTGVLFAADQLKQAHGPWINEAISSMVRSHRDAISVLKQHEVSAVTDVSGFGLAGHLWEMLRASDISARLTAESIPVLKGALTLSREGHRSSLYPANEASHRDFLHGDELKSDLAPLLYDPQTAGGLLAAVSGETAERCIEELIQAGYPDAAIIGRVEPEQPTGIYLD